MSDASKINASHLRRRAFVYLRQSSAAQVEHNRESTKRQYALASRATELGWSSQQVTVIDEDLGLSGSGAVERSGFARLAAEVGLGHVGIVLGLEVSRLARNNSDWYRLLDLCGLTDTLIGDADGIYHPAMFNDRLLLGLKGTMSEAELHILRERLNGGIRNKAARGELRRGLPVGFVWGEKDGEVCFHPDESVRAVIRNVFIRFAELGSVRRVWLHLRSEGLSFPLQKHYGAAIRWVGPSYIAIYHVLTNPVYAGVYAYGKSRFEITLDASGLRKKRVRKLPVSEWRVLIQNHHEGYIDWTPSTIHRALNDGAIAGEQLTVGAPWRIRLTNELRARFSDEALPDYFTMYQAMRRLGVSRQTVWQRVKRGELEALYVTRGRQKGLRIKLIQTQSELFGHPS
jgi:DNA invertase Pin-like site-specific DNA recombinase